MLHGMAAPPVGLLIVRAWHEAGSERPLRADVSVTADTTRGFERKLTLSDVEDVESVVRARLAEVLAAAGSRTPPSSGP
jgi:hypothetical protein